MSIIRKEHLSNRLLATARYMAELAGKHERTNDTADEKFFNELFSYVSSSIFSSVCSAESFINEIITDILEGETSSIEHIEKTKYNILNDYWVKRNMFDSILDKYETTLLILNNKKLIKEKNPYQDMNLLNKLRNELVHYKPKWQYINNEENLNPYKKILNGLQGKFNVNGKFNKDKYSEFPYQIICSGCSTWAYKSAAEFINYFWINSGMQLKGDPDSKGHPIFNIKTQLEF